MNSTRPKLRPSAARSKILQAALYRGLAEGWMEMSVLRQSENLQIHHKEFRSQSGDDTEQNLITLCSACHDGVHRGDCA